MAWLALAVGAGVLGTGVTGLVQQRTCSLEPGLQATGDGEHLVLAEQRVLLAACSSAQVAGRSVATPLLRDRTELDAVLHDLDGARELFAALRAKAHQGVSGGSSWVSRSGAGSP